MFLKLVSDKVSYLNCRFFYIWIFLYARYNYMKKFIYIKVIYIRILYIKVHKNRTVLFKTIKSNCFYIYIKQNYILIIYTEFSTYRIFFLQYLLQIVSLKMNDFSDIEMCISKGGIFSIFELYHPPFTLFCLFYI